MEMAGNQQSFPHLFQFMKNMRPFDLEDMEADQVLVLLFRDASN